MRGLIFLCTMFRRQAELVRSGAKHMANPIIAEPDAAYFSNADFPTENCRLSTVKTKGVT